ncbi:MAG: tRNA lysidine(34) synthetase TilS [Xanthobacteraceae bacterium]|uniref:tRNA lysidine(34) synthetase TilS n=1 Tax=Pseudolabrys sp. TaxID=1960880 RepID=UPI003D10FC23
MRVSDRPVSISEAKQLFAGLGGARGIMLAVSGGPDSVALLYLAARWRDGLKTKPKLFAVTVDHGLRKEARAEAIAVARLARKLNVPHRVLRWSGNKPATGLQEAARNARYRLLGTAALKGRASHVVTAHTRDDQAETVLIRMARGSGIGGLGAMLRDTPLGGCVLLRPLLDVPKARLVATVQKAGLGFADDPSNRDPRFTRARWREMMPALAREGLDAPRLALLARRMRRADEALEATAARAFSILAVAGPEPGVFTLEAGGFFAMPAEIGLRMLRHAVDRAGNEGPAELGKLEALLGAAAQAWADSRTTGRPVFRRTLAGAVVTVSRGQMTVETAPPRRRGVKPRGKPLTKAVSRRAGRGKTR